MKSLLLPALLLIWLLPAAQTTETPVDQRHALIAIPHSGPDVLTALQQAGIDLHCGGYLTSSDGSHVHHIECSFAELQHLEHLGIEYRIEIDDLTEHYRQNTIAHLPLAKAALEQEKVLARTMPSGDPRCAIPDYPVPQQFRLGEMGGFLYYEEILDMLDSMHLLYPQLISPRMMLHPDLRTHQDRPVYWIKITGRHNEHVSKSEVLYTALTHAREPASAMSMLYFMWYLLEHYEDDTDIQQILDRTELYFIPVVNPDGYVHNQTNAPQGGGMWRKNLRDNNLNGVFDGQDGVDLNRNYGYLWGLDNSGSSPIPASNTYRGPEPFSEPETQMIRAFVLSRNFTSSMHNHSYGNDLYYPWDNGVRPLPEAAEFYRISDLMSWHNRYLFGETHRTYWLGAINGGANDWFYGEQDEKPMIYPWIAEIGEVFWPDPLEIVRICKQQMGPQLTLARCAGTHVLIHDLNPPVFLPHQNVLAFRIENLGLLSTPLTIRVITPEGSDLQLTPARLQIDPLSVLEAREIEIGIDHIPLAATSIEFDIVVESDGVRIAQLHISKETGGIMLFADDVVADTLVSWQSATWGPDMDPNCPDEVCIADSPMGNQLNAFTSIMLRDPLDLSEVAWAYATFHARWSIESTHDFVQLQARTGDGAWTPLCGIYTKPGAAALDIGIPSPYAGQPTGEPVYDGRQQDWVSEVVDLSTFAGEQHVLLRFTAWSGGLISTITEDGFSFSGFRVYTSRNVHCTDGIHNGDEEDIDCGGSSCAPCPACSDGIQNGDEEGIDCGGSHCTPCVPTCDDGIMNGDEEGIDCGGSCANPCKTVHTEISPSGRPGTGNLQHAEQNILPFHSDNFSLTPNPASANLVLHTHGISGEASRIEVIDPTGRVWMHQLLSSYPATELQITHLPAQLYVVRLTDGKGGIFVQRFLKVD